MAAPTHWYRRLSISRTEQEVGQHVLDLLVAATLLICFSTIRKAPEYSREPPRKRKAPFAAAQGTDGGSGVV